MRAHQVKPGSKLNLEKIDPAGTGKYASGEDGKAKAGAVTREELEKMRKLQERLIGNANRALLIVLQGMDTSGKDGTIKHVMSGVNPQGCLVTTFKEPTQLELAHDFLWRIHQEVPRKGYIGIFNRSHYEDVLISRVHGWVSDKLAEERFRQINHFEELLHDSGTMILKFFLHISKEEQGERLEARVRDPEKRWKFNPKDLKERKLWPQYRQVYEDAISATSTEHAPWHVIPADRKWYRNLIVARIMVDALEEMKLKTPPAPEGVDFDQVKIV